MDAVDLIVFARCFEGDIAAVESFIQNGFPVNSQNSEGNSLLHISASNGFLHLSGFLLDKGAAIDLTNNYGWTSLMHAARHGHSDIVSLLIKAKAKVNVSNRFGLRALDLAAWSGDVNCVNLLVDAGAVIDNIDGQNDLCDLSPLMAASVQGHDSVIQILIGMGSSIAQASPITGLTPLMLAACCGHLPSTKILVKSGMDVNSTSMCGQTALDFAAACNHQDVKTFLESLTVPKFVKTSGDIVKTNILLAVKNGNLDLVKLLLERNQSLCNYSDPSVGVTPLMFASMHGHLHLIELLLSSGADINAQDSTDGWTPLMHAVFHRQSEAVHFLLDKGAKVDICSLNGYTALDLAIHIDSSETDIVDTLLVHSAPDEVVETQEYLTVTSGSSIRRSRKSTEKTSSRGDSPVRFKEWIGGLSSHLRSRSKSSATSSTSGSTNLEPSSSDVFLDNSSPEKSLEGNYLSISKLYAPNQRFSQALKEQVVRAVVLPPFPSQPSYIESIKRYSRKSRSKNKNPKSCNSLQCPNLVKRHFERMRREGSSTVTDERKNHLESFQNSTLRAPLGFENSQHSLVKSIESKSSSSNSTTKGLSLSCYRDYHKDVADKARNSLAFTKVAESLSEICKGSLQKYAEKFHDQEIDFETFKHLTEDDLCEIGVQSLESRNKFLEIIEKFKNS